ncbi:transposable element Tcb1 transposase [Trichonephila clavipes]|nr:transposable element Tcb1 transposase [Trichonephila clavipes]
MPPNDEIRRNSNNLRNLNWGRFRPSRRRVFLSSCAVEQFHSDVRLAPNHSNNWQWTMEGDRGLRARVPLHRIPLTANHRRLRLQWSHEHRAWQANWHQVVVSDESRFNLLEHDGCIPVRRYADKRCFPDCVIERHSGLTSRVMIWGAISYHGRSNLLRIEGNLNSTRYVR